MTAARRSVLRSAISALLYAALFVTVLSTSAFAAGVLRVGVQLEPPNLDPTVGAAAATDEIVYANIFEGLTRITENGGVAPALAKRWESSADGQVWDFHLHDNVRFHDGAAFDASDVVFTFERIRAPGAGNAQAALFALIERVEAVAPNHVRFRLAEPLGAFPTYVGWGDAVIVDPASAATNAAKPVGTGPFRFVEWRKGAYVEIRRFEDYWGQRPALDGVDFVFIPDPTAAYAALMAGDVDGFPNYPAPENLRLVERLDRFNIVRGVGEGEMILAINNARPPLDDIRVRRALSHAIDKRTLIDIALFGEGAPIGSHYPPHRPAYVDLAARYPFDPARAKALLKEAGAESLELTLALPPPAYARRSGDVIAAQLAAIGVEVRIRRMEWAQWLEQIFANHDFDLTIVAHTEPEDIDIYARDNYYFQYRNDAFRTLIADIRRETSDVRRNELLAEAQIMLADDAVNVFLAQGAKLGVWRKSVSGVWADAPVQANDFTGADVAGRAPLRITERQRAAGPGAWPLVLIIGAILGITFRMQISFVYLLRRLAVMGATMLAASLVVFILLDLAPGDPAAFMLGLNASPEAVAGLRAELGLDRPAPARFASWLADMARGDFGDSYTYRTPVATLIGERLWVSAPLAIAAFALSLAIGLPAGVAAATHAGRLRDRAISGLAQAGVATPNFWLAILFVMLFAVQLRWFSAGGFPGWDNPAGAIKALLLPAIALALPQAAILTQITRSSLLETAREDYILTAMAKGLTRRQALRRHGLRNAVMPILTILALQFAFLVAGAIIIETVFYLPGLGRLVFQSVAQRDLIVVKGVVMILVGIVVLASFIADIGYAVADPRLRRDDAKP